MDKQTAYKAITIVAEIMHDGDPDDYWKHKFCRVIDVLYDDYGICLEYFTTTPE